MNRSLLWLRIRRAWITVGIGATVGLVTWSLLAYRASPDARAAAVSDNQVDSQRSAGIWRFAPAPDAPVAPVGLVFFPGALVDPTAYAPLARAVAAAGYPVILAELPRRGAFGGADDPGLVARTAEQMRRPGGPRRWIIAGHSRGAVVAAAFAARRPPNIVGLVLIGTTHPRDVDLSTLTIPVTKIIGSNDRIAPESRSAANRHLLPAVTRWVRIAGGNHSQFGWYGFQPFDGFAGTPAASQRSRMIEAVLDMLRANAESAASYR